MERNQPACGSGQIPPVPTEAGHHSGQSQNLGSGGIGTASNSMGSSSAGGVQEVKERTREATEGVKQQVRETTDRLKEGWEQTREQTTQAASDAAQRLREQGSSIVHQQKDRAAEELSHFGAAIRAASDKLHDEEDHNVASYATMLADQVDDISGYLRDRDLGRMIDDAGEMARRRPELFFGGMFLIGLTAARFLKASSRPRRNRQMIRSDREMLPERYQSEWDEWEPLPASQPVGVQNAGAFGTVSSSNLGTSSTSSSMGTGLSGSPNMTSSENRSSVDVGSIERICGTQHSTAGNGPTGLGVSASTERTSASGQSLSGVSGSPKVAGSSQPDVPPACATNPSDSTRR